MMNPLPDLRARDFDRGSILHQIVDGNAAGTAQPRFEVLEADADVVAESGLGNRAFGHFQQVGSCDMHVFALPIDLVRGLHHGVKFFHRDWHQSWMRYPGAIMTVVSLAPLIGPHAFKRLFVRLWIA